MTKKEWCDNCQKEKVPKKTKLETGGFMHFCPDCGLALSAPLITRAIKLL